jgi:type 1 glutamine amidotransferase
MLAASTRDYPVGTRTLALLVVSLLAAALAASSASAANPRVLVFSKTAGYRHASIPAGIAAIRELGAKNGFDVTPTEDAGAFSAAGLAPYAAVVFLLTTGDVLDAGEQAAFEAWYRAGHGYVGVHSASDTERDWSWYGRLVGAWSSGHPEIQTASIDVATPRDDSTSALPARWTREDEWYGFLTNPRGSGVRVLLTLDESSYEARDWSMGADHPIAWSHSLDGGHAWYTAGGHTEASYSEPLFLGHLLGGIRYALDSARDVPAAPTPEVRPGIRGLTVSVRDRRIHASFRVINCTSCRAMLVVRSKLVRLRVANGVATGRSAVLPPGRWRVTVSVANGGDDVTTGRSLRVRVR